jgi:hypothetical protein
MTLLVLLFLTWPCRVHSWNWQSSVILAMYLFVDNIVYCTCRRMLHSGSGMYRKLIGWASLHALPGRVSERAFTCKLLSYYTLVTDDYMYHRERPSTTKHTMMERTTAQARRATETWAFRIGCGAACATPYVVLTCSSWNKRPVLHGDPTKVRGCLDIFLDASGFDHDRAF